MGQVMVRIGEHTHQALRELAQADHPSMREVLEKAVEEYRRRRILEEANAAYAVLRNEPEAWREMQAEQAEWEALSDGLPEGEAWTEEGQVSRPDGKRAG
jgi:DNA-binding FadR family transcriptional regulator